MPSTKAQKRPSNAVGGVPRAPSGGVAGVIALPKKEVEQFPLMSYVSQHCNFEYDAEDFSIEDEDSLKAASNLRVEDLLKQAAKSANEKYKEMSSGDETERKKALELLHSMERSRNQEETWKVVQSNPKKGPDYKNQITRTGLHPLDKKNDKDVEYFSGTRKIKPPRERKRSRSDDVIMLDNGKLVPKNVTAQLPIEITLPTRGNQYRNKVPSVGLPFTAGPPPHNTLNPWKQRSGSDLFSDVQTSSIPNNEEEDMARAIAESLRTAKLEQDRALNFRDFYSSPIPSNVSADAKQDEQFSRLPADPIGTNWDDGCSSGVSSNKGAHAKEKQDNFAESNNNLWDCIGKSSAKADQLNIDQRPRYSSEAKKVTKVPASVTFQSPINAVSYNSSKGKVTRLESQEDVGEHLVLNKQLPPREWESKSPIKSLRSTSSVNELKSSGEQFNLHTSIGKKQVPGTSSFESRTTVIEKPSMMDDHFKASERKWSPDDIQPVPSEAKSAQSESEYSLLNLSPRAQAKKGDQFSKEKYDDTPESFNDHIPLRTRRSPAAFIIDYKREESHSSTLSVGDKPKPSKLSISLNAFESSTLNEKKPSAQTILDKNVAQGIHLQLDRVCDQGNKGEVAVEPSKVPKLPTTKHFANSQLPEGNLPQGVANVAQQQILKTLLMQQGMGGLPPLISLSNQNLGCRVPQDNQGLEEGGNILKSRAVREQATSDVPITVFGPSNSSFEIPGLPNNPLGSNQLPNSLLLGMSGLMNTLPAAMVGLPSNVSGHPSGYPNSNTLPCVLGLPNFPVVPNVPTSLPGIPDVPGNLPGAPNIPGNLLGFPSVPVGLQSVPNPLPAGLPGFPTAPVSGFPNQFLPGIQGMPKATNLMMPGSHQGFPSSLNPGMGNCNSFGGMTQTGLMAAFTSAPVLTIKGRGRLARDAP